MVGVLHVRQAYHNSHYFRAPLAAATFIVKRHNVREYQESVHFPSLTHKHVYGSHYTAEALLKVAIISNDQTSFLSFSFWLDIKERCVCFTYIKVSVVHSFAIWYLVYFGSRMLVCLSLCIFIFHFWVYIFTVGYLLIVMNSFQLTS